MGAPTVARTVLVLDDGRRVEHAHAVTRWDALELDGAMYFATATHEGVDRATGRPVTLAMLERVRP